MARSAPEGRLDDFQRSKLRLWADYHADLGRWGSLNLAPIYRYNSARTFSLAAEQSGAQQCSGRRATPAMRARRCNRFSSATAGRSRSRTSPWWTWQ